MKPKKPKPKVTASYRIGLTCQIGRDAIEKQTAPCGLKPLEYAVYNLLFAVEELAKMVEEKKGSEG